VKASGSLLHSKLQSGGFPLTNEILEKVQTLLKSITSEPVPEPVYVMEDSAAHESHHDEELEHLIAGHRAIIFGASSDKRSQLALMTLDEAGMDVLFCQLDKRIDGPAFAAAVAKKTGTNDLPIVFISGRYITGGQKGLEQALDDWAAEEEVNPLARVPSVVAAKALTMRVQGGAVSHLMQATQAGSNAASTPAVPLSVVSERRLGAAPAPPKSGPLAETSLDEHQGSERTHTVNFAESTDEDDHALHLPQLGSTPYGQTYSGDAAEVAAGNNGIFSRLRWFVDPRGCCLTCRHCALDSHPHALHWPSPFWMKFPMFFFPHNINNTHSRFTSATSSVLVALVAIFFRFQGARYLAPLLMAECVNPHEIRSG